MSTPPSQLLQSLLPLPAAARCSARGPTAPARSSRTARPWNSAAGASGATAVPKRARPRIGRRATRRSARRFNNQLDDHVPSARFPCIVCNTPLCVMRLLSVTCSYACACISIYTNKVVFDFGYLLVNIHSNSYMYMYRYVRTWHVHRSPCTKFICSCRSCTRVYVVTQTTRNAHKRHPHIQHGGCSQRLHEIAVPIHKQTHYQRSSQRRREMAVT